MYPKMQKSGGQIPGKKKLTCNVFFPARMELVAFPRI
jgi:hypothetical protein